MESSIKNILVVLVVLSVAFLGYYFYAQQVSTAPNDEVVKSMLASTEAFLGRSQELEQIAFDMSLFEDSRFKTLHSFTKPVSDKPVGRTDPFAAVGASQ
jgi:hypothetical protein